MTWDTLETKLSYIKDVNSDVIRVGGAMPTDTEFIGLFKDLAKSRLKSDIINACGLDPNNYTSSLDSIVDKNTDLLQTALAYKQLEIYYYQNNDNDANYLRFQSNKNEYDKTAKRFSNLLRSTGNVNTSGTVGY